MTGDTTLIGGLACPWDILSRPVRDTVTGESFCEKIAPGAFKESLKPGREILLLQEHQALNVLARRSNGTLKIWEAAGGLRFLADLQGAAYGSVWLAIESRRICGVSVGMRMEQRHTLSAGVREVTAAVLEEVSLCGTPAYPTRLTFDAAPQQSLRQLARDVAKGDFQGDTSAAHLARAIELERRMDEWERSAMYRNARAKLPV